jgi:hypothetical protein
MASQLWTPVRSEYYAIMLVFIRSWLVSVRCSREQDHTSSLGLNMALPPLNDLKAR